jgi:hypothetical protein
VKGPNWDVQVQFYGDDAAWHTVYSNSGAPDVHLESSVSLASQTQLTDGKLYTWRVQVRSTAGSAGSAAVWALTIRPSAVSGWVTPPTFTAGAVSSASDMNTLRTDLYALHEWLPAYNHLQTGVAPKGTGLGTTGQWLTFWRGSLRWRQGQSLHCGAEFRGYLNVGTQDCTWGVDLNYSTRSGEYWQVLNVLSRTITKAELDSGGGEFVRFEATIPAATFGALTAGTYYALSYWMYLGGSGNDGNSITGRRPVCARVPAVAPFGGWPTLAEWEHGHWASPDRLNAISTGLTALAPGGSEALWPEMPVTGGGAGVLVHMRPWLVYFSSGSVTLHYGVGYGLDYSLPQGSGRQSFDLSQVTQLTYGSRYLIEGTSWAAEADEAYHA